MDDSNDATTGALPAPTMYSFSMLEMTVLEDFISYTFMSRNRRFIIQINAERLKGEGKLVEEFNAFKTNLDDPDVWCDFETWVIDSIHPQVQKLIPLAPSKPTSLLDYYGCESHVFELFNDGGLLSGKELPFDPQVFGDAGPRVVTIEGPENDISKDRKASGRGTVLRCKLPEVLFIPASQLLRSASLDSREEIMCEIPRIVRMCDTNEEFFFKAANTQQCFQREIDILTKLRTISQTDLSLRTSRVVGLVTWDGKDDLLMGMLLSRIEGSTLQNAMRKASVVEKRKWMAQIDETVQKLHRYGVVWGDVKPSNVMIGPGGDAVVIDFGGGFTNQYVDAELQETAEGDVQGLKRLRKMLLR